MQFVHSFRLAQISGAVGGNGQFDGHSRWLYFLFGFFEGGVDDGEGEWNLLVYLTEIIHKMRGLKVSATIAVTDTIAKRAFFGGKNR